MNRSLLSILSIALCLYLSAVSYANDAEDLNGALKQLIDASKRDFADVCAKQGREVTDDGDEIIYRCTISVPGSKSSRIWFYKADGYKPSLRCTMASDLEDGREAARRYDELKKAITTTVPSSWSKNEETREGQSKSVTFETSGAGDSPVVRLRWDLAKSSRISLVIEAPEGRGRHEPPGGSGLSAAEAVSLVMTDVEIKWHAKSEEATVDFTLPYKNISDKPIICTIRVASGQRPRDAAAGDYSEWEEKFNKSFQMTLRPGETKKVSGTLQWFRRTDTMPVLRYPDRTDRSPKLLQARFAE